MRTFYLGVEAAWLTRPAFTDVPMFVTYSALAVKQRLDPAVGPVAIDSGGYTQVTTGGWRSTPAEYATGLRRIAESIGPFDFAVGQDIMCTPDALAAMSYTVDQAITATVNRYLWLRDAADGLTIAPVIQGWAPDDYERCVDAYGRAGIDLAACDHVAVGSLAARSASSMVEAIVARLALAVGLDNLHGLGMKIDGLRRSWPMLDCADSHAWSYAARRRFYDTGRPMFDTCTHSRCNHCPRWALAWRDDVLAAARGRVQLALSM